MEVHVLQSLTWSVGCCFLRCVVGFDQGSGKWSGQCILRIRFKTQTNNKRRRTYQPRRSRLRQCPHHTLPRSKTQLPSTASNSKVGSETEGAGYRSQLQHGCENNNKAKSCVWQQVLLGASFAKPLYLEIECELQNICVCVVCGCLRRRR